jgi:hypothetical protein
MGRTAQRVEVKLKSFLYIGGEKIELETINISNTGALLKSLKKLLRKVF